MNNNHEKEDYDINYYMKNSRFFHLLKATKKYEDIYKSKEALLSLVLTIITIGTLSFSYINEEIFIMQQDKLLDFVGIIIGGMFGLLGFLIGGLALIVGSIAPKIMEKINDNGKFNSLVKIVFVFYLDGMLIFATIVLMVITYIVLLSPFEYSFLIFLIMGSVNSYLFYYSLISSVMLMGTCIRLMFLNYLYNELIDRESQDSK